MAVVYEDCRDGEDVVGLGLEGVVGVLLKES